MRARDLCFLLAVVAAAPSRARAGHPSSGDAEPIGVADAEARAEAEAAPETIVVEGSAAPVDTPSAGVRVVTARELALTPHKNADDLLRVVPGLYTSQHGAEGKGQQFFLRGFDAVHGADLSIRVGGVPISERSNVHGQGYADLGFLIPETVGGLVSRKGPFDLEQGWFATAGALDLELGVAQRGARIGYEVGSTQRHRLVLIEAPADGPAGQFVAAELLHDDGFGEHRGTDHGSLIGQTELRAGALVLRPLVVGAWSEFGEPGVIPLDDLARGYFDRGSAPAGALVGQSRRVLTGLGASWRRGGDEIVASAHLGWRGLAIEQNFTGFLDSEIYGDGRRQTHQAISGGARVAWRHRVSPGLRVVSGVELIRDQISQAEQRISTARIAWRDERSLEAAISSGGAWAGLELRRGRWSAIGGARVDAMQVDAEDRLDRARDGAGRVASVAPRLAIAWRGERAAISVAAGRGHRPPEARAFTERPSRENMEATIYDGGAPEITAADAVELGGELRWSRLSVGATGFATWIDRESVFDHVSGVNALRDGSRRIGGELFVAATPLPWLALRGDLTAVDARFVVTENPVPGAPRLLATFEARLDRRPWSAGVAGRFLGPRPLVHGATAAASTVIDAVVGWTRGRWALELAIDNLLGSSWNEGEYHFASRWDLAAPRSELPRVHIAPGRPFGARLGATLQF